MPQPHFPFPEVRQQIHFRYVGQKNQLASDAVRARETADGNELIPLHSAVFPAPGSRRSALLLGYHDGAL